MTQHNCARKDTVGGEPWASSKLCGPVTNGDNLVHFQTLYLVVSIIILVDLVYREIRPQCQRDLSQHQNCSTKYIFVYVSIIWRHMWSKFRRDIIRIITRGPQLHRKAKFFSFFNSSSRGTLWLLEFFQGTWPYKTEKWRNSSVAILGKVGGEFGQKCRESVGEWDQSELRIRLHQLPSPSHGQPDRHVILFHGLFSFWRSRGPCENAVVSTGNRRRPGLRRARKADLYYLTKLSLTYDHRPVCLFLRVAEGNDDSTSFNPTMWYIGAGWAFKILQLMSSGRILGANELRSNAIHIVITYICFVHFYWELLGVSAPLNLVWRETRILFVYF